METIVQIFNFHKTLLLAWLCILLIPVTVYAADVSIGSDHVSIAIPKGYCLMNSSEPSDSRLIQYLEDGNREINKVLLVFADCSQLKSWRIGELPNLDDYGYVLAPKSLIKEPLIYSSIHP